VVFSSTVTLHNTIVADNFEGSGTTTENDIIASNGAVDASSANNLIGTGGSGGLTNGTNGNQVGVANPLLGPLTDNGGPTKTHALLSGSPAIDRATAVADLTTDQRGLARNVGRTDIGAIETAPKLSIAGRVASNG